MSFIDTVLGRKPSLEDLRQIAARHEDKRLAMQSEIDALESARQENAVAAADGDAVAQDVLDKANARIAKLQRQLADLSIAIDARHRQIANLEADERAAARARKVQAQNERVAKCLDKVREIAGAMEILVPAVVQFYALEEEALTGHRELGGRGPDGKPFAYGERRDLVTARMYDYLASLGMPIGLFSAAPLAAWKEPTGRSLVEAEAEALRAYEIAR